MKDFLGHEIEEGMRVLFLDALTGRQFRTGLVDKLLDVKIRILGDNDEYTYRHCHCVVIIQGLRCKYAR